MLGKLSCAELAEHEMFERLDMEAEGTRRQRREEERMMEEAVGMVKRGRRNRKR
jgi:hypothetical protein